MIWFVIAGLVAIVIIIFICRDDWNDFFEKITMSFSTLLVSFAIASFVFFFASIITSYCAEIEYNVVSDTKIIALKDNQNINGNFYIFGGYVDEDLYYYYATETEFGYKTKKLKADDAYIKYTDGEPHIERLDGKFVNDNVYLLGSCMSGDRYIIYCPEGTVTNEFKVDLE